MGFLQILSHLTSKLYKVWLICFYNPQDNCQKKVWHTLSSQDLYRVTKTEVSIKLRGLQMNELQ